MLLTSLWLTGGAISGSFIVQQESCHIMSHVVTCAMNTNDVMHISHHMHTPALSHPLVFMMHQKLLTGMLLAYAEQLLLKLTTSHFHTLNNENENENVMKRILTAMHNESKANFNENFRAFSQEPIAHLYKQ